MEKQEDKKVPHKPSASHNRSVPARLHYSVLAAVYFIMLIVALVALGSFGAKEAQVRGFRSRHFPSSPGTCILYSSFTGEFIARGIREIRLGSGSACGFVLWSQASVLIVVTVWLIYNIVLAVLGLKM